MIDVQEIKARAMPPPAMEAKGRAKPAYKQHRYTLSAHKAANGTALARDWHRHHPKGDCHGKTDHP
ncbi:hypothetical protein, partial [Craterilacuibacter sp.]|uniref:hypothetical protein n=1 Tax=Craterilacuibacter sp. TaxID=2870909 RepID=UPI003F346898